MPLLTSGIINTLIRVAASTMTGTCTIVRKTQTSDGLGGRTDVWTTLYTVPCRLWSLPQEYSETIDQERIEVLERWHLAIPVGQDINIKDRVVIGSNTYEVQAYAAPESIEVERVVELILVVT